MSLVPNRDEWFDTVHELPRARWPEIDSWIVDEVDAEVFNEAWDEFIRRWLTRLKSALGPEYRWAESHHFQMVATKNERECARMLDFTERAYARMEKTLDDLIGWRWGRIPILRFDSSRDYYRYIAYFYDDTGEELPMSGGMFLREGCPHVVCHSTTWESYCATVVHELSHLSVCHLPLPTWVNEGLAMAFEAETGSVHFPDAEQIKLHRQYWNEDTIQHFWTGRIWESAGETFGMGYELAAMIFDIIRRELNPPPEAFREFIRHARREDGGAEAARKHLRASLGEIVADFLGPGEWEPRTWS